MLSAVTFLCFSLQMKSFLASDHITVPAVGLGSDRSIENTVQDFINTSQALLVNVSQQHIEGNLGGKQKQEWKGKTFMKKEDEMVIKEDWMRHHTESGRRKKVVVERKTTEDKVKESTVGKSKSVPEKAKSSGAQASGWYWAAETVDVTTIPIITYAAQKALANPSTSNQRSSHQQSAIEETTLTLEFHVDGHHLILDLHPTRNLLGATYKEATVGTIRDSRPPVECEFQGNIRGMIGSWVALSLCDGIRGVIMGRALELLVEPILGASSLKELHHIYSNKLFQHPSGACGVRHGEIVNSWRKHSKSSSNISEEKGNAILHRERREALHGGPLWTNKTTLFVELVLVADNSYYSTYNGKTAARCRETVNVVNALFQPLGVMVVLTYLEIWESKDEIDVSKSSNKTLENMKAYRQKFLSSFPDVPNDNMQLLTTVDFEEVTIGKASISGICSYQESVGIVQDQKFDNVISVAQTMAHEIGHNLGLGHDEDDKDCQCDTDECIMASTIGSGNLYIGWSSCSKRNITKNLKTAAYDCLKNIPSKLLPENSCGNGIVEEGEECDCGPPEFCKNVCCIANSCKLASYASCASGSCCDTQTCKPKAVWTLCRAAVGECDIPEHCTGDSEFCPSDTVKSDGTYCRGGKGHCYKGECGSHEGRCQQVWGASASAGSSQCYIDLNQKGDSKGNCGILEHNSKEFQPCSADDALCGSLHCHTDTDVKPKSSLVSYTLWSNDDHDCRTVISDDNPPSFWLSPDGASCGNGLMCVNQKCVPIPVSMWVILFWIVLILVLAATCCMWDHLRWWWEKKGRACVSPTVPCCATCLDTCCCPVMTKIFYCCWYPLMFRVIQWIKRVCPFCKPKEPSPKGVDPRRKGTSDTEVFHMDQNTDAFSQINFWPKADGQLVVELFPNTPQNTSISSNSSVLYHNGLSTDHSVHHNPIKVPSLLNEVNSSNNWSISSDIIESQLSRTTPVSQKMVIDDGEVLDKLSKLTHNLSVLSGKENKPQNIGMSQNSEYLDKTCELPYNQQIPPPQGSCTSPVKFVPVRKAPLPPVLRTVEGDGDCRPSEPVMDSGTGHTISQRSEPTIPPRPGFTIPIGPEPATSPRQEPVVPPRPDATLYSKPEAVLPPRSEPVVAPRSEPVVAPRPDSVVPSRPEPVVPPRPEFSHPSRQKPTIPPKPQS